MAIETAANTMATTTQQALTTATGSVKVFLLAHPVGSQRKKKRNLPPLKVNY